MAYNSSSARHLLPEPTPTPAPTPKTVARRRYRVIENRKQQSGLVALFNIKTLITFFIIVGGICFMLYNQACLNEVSEEISSVKASITQLESEHVRMQSSLESTVSITNISRRAEQELGLQRLDSYQTEYVSIYEDDRIELIPTRQPQGFSEQIEAFVSDVSGSVKGLFGG